jgi:hypothetical protein
MSGKQINRVSGKVLIALSLLALLMVASGYFQAPQADEGTAAHVFQLAVLACVVVAAVFLATADWKQPVRNARVLALPAVVLTLAFSALFYLEHIFYPAHYR